MLYATSAHVDLKAIEANLRAVRGQVGDRLVLLAVKADAYGHGAVAVSLMCQRTGAADWLGVATVPEALELRAAGVTLPILKLSHALTPAEASAAVDAGVALTVIDEPGARLVSRAASGRRAEVHLKVDTGMRRIGVEPGGAVPLARLLRRLPRVPAGPVLGGRGRRAVRGRAAAPRARRQLRRRLRPPGVVGHPRASGNHGLRVVPGP